MRPLGFLIVLLFSSITFQAQAKSKLNLETLNLTDQAKKELEVSALKSASQIRPTPATVRARVEEVESPVSYTAIQMGLSYQRFHSQGQGEIVGQKNASWDDLSDAPMIAVEFRWLPYQPFQAPFFLGSFVNLGYAEQKMSLETSTGERFHNAKLHTAKWGLGLSAEYHIRQVKWLGLAGNLGFGEMYGVQSSTSAYTSSSHQLTYLSSGLFAQFKLSRHWKLFAGNDYRVPTRKETSDFKIQRNNWTVGFLGSFD
jgi:hypothetical protein